VRAFRTCRCSPRRHEIAAPKRQRLLKQRVQVGRIAGKDIERVGDAVGDRITPLAENVGMVRVGGDTLQSVKHQCAQADDIRAHRLDAGAHANRADGIMNLGKQAGKRVGGYKGSWSVQRLRRQAGLLARCFVGRAQAVADLRRLGDQCHEAGAVEVDVGQGGEQREQHEAVGLMVRSAESAEARPVLADALELVDQHILQIGRGLTLAAHAFGGGAAGGRCRLSRFRSHCLFALKAKHAVIPVPCRCNPIRPTTPAARKGSFSMKLYRHGHFDLDQGHRWYGVRGAG